MVVFSLMNRSESKKEQIKIGVISDTHGMLRPEATEALDGVDLIIHAGDIGNPAILKQLEQIAPVVPVRGNMDSTDWAHNLEKTSIVEKNKTVIYVIHDLSRMDLEPAAAKINVVISGHSHKPSISKHNGVLYLNPGSAGPRRFSLPVSVALLYLRKDSIDAEIVKLKNS